MLKSRLFEQTILMPARLALAIALMGFAHAAAKEKILHSFSCTDGCYPPTGLVMDKTGRMYGVTEGGGPANAGSVFSVNTRGKFKSRYEFQGGSDGSDPLGALVVDASGNLYGTTAKGGGDCDCGLVFKINGRGKKITLHVFTGTDGDGEDPLGGLISDPIGNLYGTTYSGGQGHGTVFKISPTGETTILHAFAGGSDGSNPSAGLVADESGNLYGTTEQGGDADICPSGCGTVFELKNGTKEKVLYAFSGGVDGTEPEAPLAIDGTGYLYGTTMGGGKYDYGTVFRVSLSGKETVVYAFAGDADGGEPFGGVIVGADGELYGANPIGGTSSNAGGVVFQLSRNGKFNVLHSFAGEPDGTGPYGELTMDSGGDLYGTTIVGGANNVGIIYRLSN